MNDILECFGNIIGLEQDSDSDSGLFVTDLEALSTLNGLVGTEDWADVQVLMDSARRIAILNLNTDLTAKIMSFAKPRPGFKGNIGVHKYIRQQSATGKSGIRLLCNPVEHAEFQLKSISVLMPTTKTVTVNVASNYNENVESYAINAIGGKLTTKATNLVLPLYTDILPMVEYYIYHEEPTYLQNKILQVCCGRRFLFNTEKPTFSKWGYGHYIMAGGFMGEPESLGIQADNNAYGIMLSGEISCRVDKLICDGEIDFSRNPMAQSYALAIQHKAGSVILWNIMRSSKLNRVLMQDIDTFREAATYYERKYRDIVKQIAKDMPLGGSCFCEHGFTKAWIG